MGKGAFTFAQTAYDRALLPRYTSALRFLLTRFNNDEVLGLVARQFFSVLILLSPYW